MAYHIFKAQEGDFDRFYDLMEQSFPPNEMRTRAKNSELFSSKENYSVYCLGEEGHSERLMAFIIVWELSPFIFIENFAVDTAVRGKGFGGMLLDWVIEKYQKPVILEVEPPVDLMTRRRVGFYESHGFHLCTADYLMPPLREGDKFLPLKLMSHPNAIPDQGAEPIRKLLYKEVYDRL